MAKCDLCGSNEATNYSPAYGGVCVCSECMGSEDFGC